MSGGERTPHPGDRLASVIEALLFSSGEPVDPDEIVAIGASPEEIEAAVEELKRRYERQGAGLRVERIAGGFQLATTPEVGPWVRRFFRHRNRARISAAALETLAVVAYRQPVTAPEIQAIRGVDPTASLKTLVDRKLVRIRGRKKVLGRPILYGTSREFLVHFGLDRLDDLPPIEDFEQFAPALDALIPEGEEEQADPADAAGEPDPGPEGGEREEPVGAGEG